MSMPASRMRSKSVILMPSMYSHGEQAVSGPFVDDAGDDDVRPVRELSSDRLHVLGLVMHVYLARDVEGELAVDGLEREGVEAGFEPEDRLQDPEVRADEALDVRVDDLDGDFAAIVKPGAVDLGERGGGDWPRVEFGEGFFDRDAELRLDVRAHEAEGARRHAVLEFREGLDVFLGEEVRAAAERLTDLDHEALEAKDAAVDLPGAFFVVAAHAAGVCVLGHAALAGVEGLVAEEDACGDSAGVAEADDAYVTQRWNGHWRGLLTLLAVTLRRVAIRRLPTPGRT